MEFWVRFGQWFSAHRYSLIFFAIFEASKHHLMPNRRKFLKLSALTAGGYTLARCTAGERPSETALAEGKEALSEASSRPQGIKPLVISTWMHGQEANAAAWALLKDGGRALDAVEQGVRVTEADLTNRSVGLGGLPDRDGKVTLDACIMDHDSRCGAVAFLQNMDHPISVARAVMEHTPHVMLAGVGAYDFALSRGFEPSKVESPVPKARRDWQEWLKEGEYRPKANIENHDTISMLALDRHGKLAGACTTSGMAYKMHGRIGDSPIIGSGLFIDSDVGAAAATGLGEAVMRVAGSSAVVELMRHGATPKEACEAVVRRILKKHPDAEGLQVGFIAIDNGGRHGAYSVYQGFNYAITSPDDAALVDADYLREWE